MGFQMWTLMERAAARQAQKAQQEVAKQEEADGVRESMSVEPWVRPEAAATTMPLSGRANTVPLWTLDLLPHVRCAINAIERCGENEEKWKYVYFSGFCRPFSLSVDFFSSSFEKEKGKRKKKKEKREKSLLVWIFVKEKKKQEGGKCCVLREKRENCEIWFECKYSLLGGSIN